MNRDRVYMYLLLVLLVLPLPVAGYQYVMHRRAAFSGPTDYTQDANCVAAYFMSAWSAQSEPDQSGNGYTLSLGAGSINQSVNVPAGYSTNAHSRLFTLGEGDYMYNNSIDIAGANQHLSVACWVRPVTTNSNRTICSQYTSSGDQRSYLMRTMHSPSRVSVYLSSDGVGWTNANSEVTVVPWVWMHHAFTYDDTEIVLYTNGVEATSYPYTGGMYDSTANFQVGTFMSGQGLQDGRLDELIVFDRALSAAEIYDIYENGIDGTKGDND